MLVCTIVHRYQVWAYQKQIQRERDEGSEKNETNKITKIQNQPIDDVKNKAKVERKAIHIIPIAS